MTTTSEPSFPSFVATWKSSFAKVLTQLGAADVATPDTDASNVALTGSDVVTMRFGGGGCLNGQLQWSAGKNIAVQCAQLLMAEPLDGAAEFTATHLDAYLEFLRQVAGEASMAWKEIQGAPAALSHLADATGSFSPQATAAFLLESRKYKGLAIRLDLDADMLSSLSIAPATDRPEEPPVHAHDASPPRNIPSNLDLILDVQLDATIRFGKRELLLRDVFALMPGAVVELDQLVNQPAELFVAGRAVATGEVVVVDGNFGLRVNEVLSPAQRMSALPLG